MRFRLTRYVPRKFYTTFLYALIVVALLLYYLQLRKGADVWKLAPKPLTLYGKRRFFGELSCF